jgi:hypothetical protein
MALNKSEKDKVGTDTLKTILQLVRYDIPVLIVGKSSIGKSYTLIELTEKWRIPSSMLYIGSEKPENIEGLAKLISKDYDSKTDAKGNKIRTGEDILKFLKPYWFPNTSTISTQVANGQTIFDNYILSYNKPGTKFIYSYKILHQILICLMDIDYPEGENEVKAILEDRGNNNLSDVTGAPEILNSVGFTFKRSAETDIQIESAYEYTLDAEQAGRDDIRDLCMYLCTLLGYGNYWLVLDELDKVGEHETEKYAPLLHIVRERTLKSWTMKEINSKKGMPIPLKVDYGDYRSMADLIRNQITKGLPLMDCRIIGIANATKDIENALFRRFCQIIMRSTMALYPPDNEANKVMECVEEFLPNRMDISLLLKKVAFLDEVNLQWQYSFLPKILNNTDTSGNFFYQNFNSYFQNILKKTGGNMKSAEAFLSKDSKAIDNTAWGNIWRDNYLGGKAIGSDPGLQTLYQDLGNLWLCLAKEFYEGSQESAEANLAGASKVGGGTLTPIMRLRNEIVQSYQEYGDLYFDNLESELYDSYSQTVGNPSSLTSWTVNALRYIQASNENESGKYDQVSGVGEKMIPFIYQIIMVNLRGDTSIDTDIFNGQLEEVTKFFSIFLNKEGEVGNHTLNIDEKQTQKLMYGDSKDRLKGMKPAQRKMVEKQGLYGYYNYDDSLSLSIYMRFYLQGTFSIFFDSVLGDNEKYINFLQESKKGGSTEKVMNFFKNPRMKEFLNRFYDKALSDTQKKAGNGVRLKELIDKL